MFARAGTLLILAFVLVLAPACSKATTKTTTEETTKGSPEPEKVVNNQPVTLKMYIYHATLSEQQFNSDFVQPLKTKFPNVTLTRIEGSTTPVDNLIASGEIPDIIFTGDPEIYTFRDLKMAAPLSKMNTKIDWSRFSPTVVDQIKSYGENGELWAVPYNLNQWVMFYNKDIFDKFGVPYPNDLSTWDDILELSKKLTRMDSGTQYHGLLAPPLYNYSYLMGLPLMDNKTNKTVFDSEPWKRAFDIVKSFYDIPGIVPSDGKLPNKRTAFIQEKREAMLVDYALGIFPQLQELASKGQTFNWDIVTAPALKESVGTGPVAAVGVLMTSDKSPNKELVAEIMNYLTTEERQTEMSKNGFIPVLNSSKVTDSFGANQPLWKDKNIKAIFKAKPGVGKPNLYDLLVKPALNNADTAVAVKKTDMNTAIREAAEAANKAIDAELVKK